jgi:hypothetical protein
MNAKDLSRILLSPSHSIEEKAEAFTAFVHWHEALGRSTGIGVRMAREFAMQSLHEAIPSGDKKIMQELSNAIKEVSAHFTSRKLNQDAENRTVAAELRSLTPGTAIVSRFETGWHWYFENGNRRSMQEKPGSIMKRKASK